MDTKKLGQSEKNCGRSQTLDINPLKNVTLTKMNHIIEVQYMEKRNTRANILKLNSDEYIVLDTGEIKEFQKTSDRSQGKNSLYQTFKRLRYLINNNFSGASNELFITLTYKENMTDKDRLYNDVDKFLKRFRYKYKDISTIDYINVVEPQNRGAWHCHILFRFNDLDKIYIPNDEVRELWGFGFVTVRSIDKVDNLGAYLTAYLTDIAIDEIDNEFILKNGLNGSKIKEVEGKKYVKGARLCLYPKGMNIYRSSRGIKKPERIDIPFQDIKKYVGSRQPTYSSEIFIDTDDFTNTIAYYHYNLKRED